MYSKNTIKITNETGKTTQITTNNYKTKVEWKLAPNSYEYMGTIKIPKKQT